MKLITLLIITLFVDITFSFKCLSFCTCTPIKGLRTQNCDDRNLIYFPGNMDNTTQFIRLERNQISELPANLSKIVPELQEIDLRENKIERLQEGAFANIKNLVTIKLLKNEINQLHGYLLSGVESISMSLKLRYNNISAIDKDAFTNFYADTHLDLSHNSLTTLHQDTFNDMRLLTLMLENNNFETIPSGLFRRQSKLFMLKLRGNNIRQLSSNSFDGLKGLETLDLSENHLETLPHDVFNGNPLLSNLKLTSNNFRSIPSRLPENIHIQLFGNPLICDCLLKQTLADPNIKNKFSDIDDVLCFNSSLSTVEVLAEIDCRTTTASPTTVGNVTTIPIGSVNETTNRPTYTIENKGRNKNKSGVVIGVLIGLLLLIVIVLLVVYFHRRGWSVNIQDGVALSLLCKRSLQSGSERVDDMHYTIVQDENHS